jgi:hypothetical protein
MDTLHIGRDRLEVAPEFRRRIRLRIDQVLMWRRSRHVDHDDRLVGTSHARGGLGSQDLRQAQPAHAQGADPQEISSAYAVAETPCPFALEIQHI